MNTPVREGETIEGSPPVPCGIDPIQCSSAQYTREVSSREVLMRGPHLRSRGPQGPHKHMAVPLRYVSGGKSSPSVRCNRGRNTQASAEDPRSGTVAAADERNSSSNQRDECLHESEKVRESMFDSLGAEILWVRCSDASTV